MTGLGIIYGIVIVSCLIFLAWLKYSQRHSRHTH